VRALTCSFTFLATLLAAPWVLASFSAGMTQEQVNAEVLAALEVCREQKKAAEPGDIRRDVTCADVVTNQALDAGISREMVNLALVNAGVKKPRFGTGPGSESIILNNTPNTSIGTGGGEGVSPN